MVILLIVIDSCAFPILALNVGRILAALLKYNQDPPYFKDQVTRYTIINAGVTVLAGIIAGFRQFSFALVG